MAADYTVTAGLLGDGIIPEPALSYAGECDPRGYIEVHVSNESVRTLYEGNPRIVLVDEPGGKEMNCSDAFWWAVGRDRYFGEGYFPQVCLAPQGDTRTRFKLYGITPRLTNYIAICPFSGASGATGNKTNPVEWWDDLILSHLRKSASFRDMTIYSLGSSDDPPIAGTISKRGLPLRTAAQVILEARLVIAVESFGIHVAAGKDVGRTVYLNSATPPSLCSPPTAKVVRSEKPSYWDVNAIVEAVNESLS